MGEDTFFCGTVTSGYVPVDSVGRTGYCTGISFITSVICLSNKGLRAFNIFSYHDRIEYDIPDQVKKFLQYFQVSRPNYWCCFYEFVLSTKKGPVD